MDCCWLCGMNLEGKRRRYQDSSSLREMVLERVRPTPWVQAWLSVRPLEDQAAREPLCVPCVNWRRRLLKGTFKKIGRPYLQVGIGCSK